MEDGAIEVNAVPSAGEALGGGVPTKTAAGHMASAAPAKNCGEIIISDFNPDQDGDGKVTPFERKLYEEVVAADVAVSQGAAVWRAEVPSREGTTIGRAPT